MDTDRPIGDAWRALAGVGLGYAVAVGLVFVLVFAGPYLIVAGA
ncbi:hypothetical protein [Halorubrum pallidum]|uniref:Uncharacterized protein n=1 Tax=Halorubrum pallidum TaxID=1526114 RepID=A0ABD5T3G6_9EURY